MIKVDKLNFIYNPGTALETYALKDISFEIAAGEFVGIIGRTGCGKSTLIQNLNGLLKATSGDILYKNISIYSKGYNMQILRMHVGLVFQYPEYQLFEETVLADVKYGPKNTGKSEEEADRLAKRALSLVGIDESYYEKSPFELSGGEKRRVAIAGVLAMEPRALILDEPTAGLDPNGRDEILGQISKLHKELGITVILVSHSMEDVAKYTQRVIALCDGQLVYDGTPREVFKNYKQLEEIGLAAPQMVYVSNELRKAGYEIPEDAITVEEVATALKSQIK